MSERRVSHRNRKICILPASLRFFTYPIKSSYLRFIDSRGDLKGKNLNGVDEFAGLGRSGTADTPPEPVKSKLGGEADQDKPKSIKKHRHIRSSLKSRWAGKDEHCHILRLVS